MIEAPKLCAFQSELNMEKNQVNPDINDENIPTDGISTLPMQFSNRAPSVGTSWCTVKFLTFTRTTRRAKNGSATRASNSALSLPKE